MFPWAPVCTLIVYAGQGLCTPTHAEEQNFGGSAAEAHGRQAQSRVARLAFPIAEQSGSPTDRKVS